MNLYKLRGLLLFACLTGIVLIFGGNTSAPVAPKMRLSEYGFFKDNLASLQPSERVFPYEVNAPLFSDYAEKLRFVYIPDGQKMVYDAKGAFQFPEGAVIIKNFFYHHDSRHPEQGRKILETRLLVKEKSAWKSLTYIWNDEQTDALLEVAGAELPLQWTDWKGKKQKISYVVPNVNQCKGCHSFDGNFTPIGISARQLNRIQNGQNQLEDWNEKGIIDLPENFNPDSIITLKDYRTADLSNTTMLNMAARSYLDSNCAHCHNAGGPASTSGMFLGYDIDDPGRLGMNKPPVAAGRGSGNRKYGIVPGKPDQSILVYRMESNDPGIRMPELGRQVAHEEGLSLIKEWIRRLE